MFLIYLLMGFVVGLPAAAGVFTGGVVWLWFLWIVMRGILFGGGLVILLTGVRMMLAEIAPAFHGIARKIVPDRVPAAVLANATGGRRGVVIASIVGGVLLIVFQALSLPFVMNTAAGFVNAFGGNDFSIIAIGVGGLTRLISGIF